jgi:hypothetical protein
MQPFRASLRRLIGRDKTDSYKAKQLHGYAKLILRLICSSYGTLRHHIRRLARSKVFRPRPLIVNF